MRQIFCNKRYCQRFVLFSLQELQHKWVEPESQHPDQRQQDSEAMFLKVSATTAFFLSA